MSTASSPPPITHITTNIIPLSTILRKFSEFAYAEISHVIQIQPNDELKKKKLLELIVYLRQEFARLYVLTKWSKISSYDFSKLIDLLNWLHEQTNHFTNLIWVTKTLNQSLISAKLPNPDLITALEVFNKGEPILPTHNLIRQKVSTRKILSVIRDLNVLISIKFAIIEDLPKLFLDYEIKDGKLTIFNKDYEIKLSLIDENSPFQLIDFKFQNSDITDEQQHYQISNNFKKIVNEVLKKDDFRSLEKILINFNNTMKLYFIHRQLQKIKSIKHVYHPENFTIRINYWISSIVFKNSYIEIGLNKSNEIIYKWVKSDKFYKKFHEYEVDDDLSLFLKKIYKQHSDEILNDVEDLHVNKSKLQLNENTGLFYFQNSTPFLNSSLKRLNLDDFTNINENLKTIKLDFRFNEISTILTVTNWFQNDLIKLNNQELKKLSKDLGVKSIKFHTRKEWPNHWYLININHSNQIKSFITTVRSIHGNWTIGDSVIEIDLGSIDYKNSTKFIHTITKSILSHLISKELNGVTFNKVDIDELKGVFIIKTDTLLKILNCSNALYLKFEINFTTNEIFLQLKGKLDKHLKLNDFQIDKNGIFQIYQLLNFKRNSFLTNIISQLNKLSNIIELVSYLEDENLNLINVNLEEIKFQYDNEQICTLKKDFQIELPKENPHNICLISMQRYLNTVGIGKLFKYLQNSNKLMIKLNEFQSKNSKNDYHVQVISKNFNIFEILYYTNNVKTYKLIRLYIEIKIIKNDFKFFISVDDESFNQDFKFNSTLINENKSNGKILPLINGVLSDNDALNYTLDYFHNKIIQQF